MTTPRLANNKKIIPINGQALIQAINTNSTSIRAVARRCNVSFNALSIAIRRNQWQTHLPLRTLTDICDCVGLGLGDLLTSPPNAGDLPFRFEPAPHSGSPNSPAHTDNDTHDDIHRLAALVLVAGRPHTPYEIALTLGCTLETLDHTRTRLNDALAGSGIYLRFANDAYYLTTTMARTAVDADVRHLNLIASRDKPYDNTTMRILWEIVHRHTKNTYTHAEAPRVGQAMNMGLLQTGTVTTGPAPSAILLDAFPGTLTAAGKAPRGGGRTRPTHSTRRETARKARP